MALSRDMDDSILGSDAFTSVAFDGDTSIDSNVDSIDSNADDDNNCLLLGNDDIDIDVDDDEDCLFVDGSDDGDDDDDVVDPRDFHAAIAASEQAFSKDFPSAMASIKAALMSGGNEWRASPTRTIPDSHNDQDNNNNNDIEDPQPLPAVVTDQGSVVSEYLPENGSQHSRCSTSNSGTASYFIPRRRSEYAARRCKKVDMMAERYKIPGEFNLQDYIQNEEAKRRRRVVICRVALVMLSIAGFVFAAMNLRPKSSSPLPTKPLPLVEATNASGTVPEELFDGDGNAYDEDTLTIKVQNTNNNQNSNEVHRNSNMVEVPFANHHNLRFDGLLFVKDAPSSSTQDPSSSTRTTPSYNSDNNNEQQPVYSFDSYAKTLDPITEFHFSPGESTTSKHIVLTTTVPDLFNNNGVNQHPQKEMTYDPGLVLSIGLEPNGQLWLPRETGQNVVQYEVDGNNQQQYTRNSNNNNNNNNSNNNNNRHHSSTSTSTAQQDVGYSKKIYGPGDRFVLMVTEDTISLFRNDHHELVGMWMNPKAAEEQSLFTPKSFSAHGLYAQVWFKEPNSSMKVNGFTNTYH